MFQNLIVSKPLKLSQEDRSPWHVIKVYIYRLYAYMTCHWNHWLWLKIAYILPDVKSKKKKQCGEYGFIWEGNIIFVVISSFCAALYTHTHTQTHTHTDIVPGLEYLREVVTGKRWRKKGSTNAAYYYKADTVESRSIDLARSFSRIYHAPSLIPNKVPYK
jgi:hypothetical protein